MNNFPLRCRVVRRSSLGEEDQLTRVLTKAGEDMSTAIIEAVIKQCAFSLSINIGLMFVPVMGQAIAGLMSVMQMIAGKKYEKDTQQIIEETSQAIKDRAERASREVKQVGEMVYAQELPAARTLAMSNQPLDGFGSFVKSAVSSVGKAISGAASSFDDAVRRVSKSVSDSLAKAEDDVKKQAAKLEDQAKVIAKNPEAQLKFITTLSPIGLARLGIKYAGNVAVGAAKAIESTNIVGKGDLSKPLSQARENIDENMYTAQRLASPITGAQEGVRLTAKVGGEAAAKALEAAGQKAAAEDLRKHTQEVARYAYQAELAVTPIGFYNLGSGREAYLAAKAECEKMRANAFAAIDKQKSDAIAKFQSPQGRMEMRKSIAKAMRQDPAFIDYMNKIRMLEESEMAEYNKLLAQEQAAFGVLAKNVSPSTTSGAGAAVGIAAAVAAAFALS
jgi:hypothetical protein